jgi:hypothetical protein
MRMPNVPIRVPAPADPLQQQQHQQQHQHLDSPTLRDSGTSSAVDGAGYSQLQSPPPVGRVDSPASLKRGLINRGMTHTWEQVSRMARLDSTGSLDIERLSRLSSKWAWKREARR